MQKKRPGLILKQTTLIAAAILLSGSLMAWAQSDLPASVNDYTPEQIADALGWVNVQNLNLCHGYYEEPAFISQYPVPPSAKTAPTQITADDWIYSTEKGISVLTGNVRVEQPGRLVTADKGYVYRDVKTGKVQRIILIGHVHLQEAGKMVVSDRAEIEFPEGVPGEQIDITHLIYHLYQPRALVTGGEVNSWGVATTGQRLPNEQIHFTEGTYSTCQPGNQTWHIKVKDLQLDKKSGYGTARHAVLYLHGIPLFYTPYLSFPIERRRKSGFLLPTFNYSDQSGASITVPYYFNLAPNYDLTTGFDVMPKRGLKFNNRFRYLTEKNNGHIDVNFIPNDNLFSQFKANTLAQPVTSSNQPFLNRLQNDSANRSYIALFNDTYFNPNWSSHLELNHVSDDYYFQNFGGSGTNGSQDQLLNEYDLNFANENWNFLGRLQGYQTLHPIDTDNLDQYSRLPEFDLTADYPFQVYGLSYGLDSSFVNFGHASPFLPTDPVSPIGQRVSLSPSISKPVYRANRYITPKLTFDETLYQLKNNTDDNIARSLPIFDVDSGLYYDKNLTIGNHSFIQTLEPRLFYLYVPFVNQNDIPDFDTTLPVLTYDQLFRTNRFIGIDRISNANQMSAGLTSRILNPQTGGEYLDASVGMAYYLQKPRVCLDQTCSSDPIIDESISPLVSELTYYFTPHVSGTGNFAWDFNTRQVNNSGLQFTYVGNHQQIFNLGYLFARNQDPFPGAPVTSSENNLHRINLGLAWPLKWQWSALANWNYNISHSYPQSYFYGLEYDSCCWAMRLMVSRSLIAIDSNNSPKLDTGYYVQIQLKGLANFANSDPSGLINTNIPNYNDIFEGQS